MCRVQIERSTVQSAKVNEDSLLVSCGFVAECIVVMPRGFALKGAPVQ